MTSLGDIPHPQGLTPQQMLATHPYVQVPWGDSGFILMEPSSSLLVFGLALLALWMGQQLLRSRGTHQSRYWWGISLVLWGMGALAAGVSYQAFAYEIKAAGRLVVAWTSWWEVAYLLLSTASVNAMMLGVAHSCSQPPARRRLIAYAVLNTAIYSALCLSGALLADRFLVSFELMVLVTTPGYLVFFLINLQRFRHSRSRLDLRLLATWLGLGLVMGIYFLYLAAGWTEALWSRGIWFSANDVLHCGLIAWMLWIQLRVVPEIRDTTTTELGMPAS